MVGATPDERIASKAEVIAATLELLTPVERAGCVMVGDTPYDLEAATRARVPSIAFRCGGWNDADLAAARALYDGPLDLLAHYPPEAFAAAGPQASP